MAISDYGIETIGDLNAFFQAIGDAPTAHTIASHSDTVGTGAELNTLVGGGDVGALHTHAAAYQPLDAELNSLAALSYAAASFVKMTGAATFALRTIAQTKTDLSLNLVENTAHSTDAHTMSIDGRDVSVDGTKLDGIEALADVTATAETSHADVLQDGDFGSNGLMERTGAGSYGIKAIGSDVQAYDAGLASLAGLAFASASFIKMTAGDTYAVRTIAETADDLEAAIDHDNLANGGAHDYAYITGNDGATDVAAAELEELTDGSATVLHTHAGAGAHAILDGSVHSDSVADGVTRGSIIYGNATPKWDELVVGAADTFLGSDGADVSYRTAAQVMASLSGEAGAAFSFNSQNLTAIGTLAATTIGVGVAAPTDSLLKVYDDTIETTATYCGTENYHKKTAGVTDVNDGFTGFRSVAGYDQNGGVLGTTRAVEFRFNHLDGDIGSGVAGKYLVGLDFVCDLEGGKVWSNVYGLRPVLDQEAAHEITGNAFCIWASCDFDGTVGGTTYMVYLNEATGVDYGIYQNGTATNRLGGPLFLPNMKSGTTQANAGAAAGELWRDTDDANRVKLGV